MGKGRSLLLFLFALLIAIAAAWVANNWLQMRLAPDEQPTRSVLTAAREIMADEQITAADVELIRMPDHLVPSSALRDPDAVIGQFARQIIYPGEILFANRFVAQLEEPSVSIVPIPVPTSNTRRVVLRVDRVIGMGLFLEPGRQVDVLAARQGANVRTPASIQMVVQNVKVLAVDQVPSASDNSPLMMIHHVTLEVSPYQAQLLGAIRNDWQTILSLRP